MEAELQDYSRTVRRLEPRHNGAISYIYVPLGLGASLIAVAAALGVANASEFFPLLATGTVAYLAGQFAHEQDYQVYWSAAARRSLAASGGPWRVTLDETGLSFSNSTVTGRYGYSALSDCRIVGHFVVAWRMGQPMIVAPVRAFPDAAIAQAFAAAVRSRVTPH